MPSAEPLPPCNVIIQNAENSFTDVIKPRLQQLGADFSRIKSINEEQGRLSLLSPKIEEVITRYDAKLFTIDPIQAYMNMYKLENVRETLAFSIAGVLGNLGAKGVDVLGKAIIKNSGIKDLSAKGGKESKSEASEK